MISALSDVKNKLLKTRQIRDAEACALYMTSLFPYLVQLFLVSPAPEALLPQWLSVLLEKMDEPDNFAAGLPRLLALANMSQEHLTRPQPLLSAVHRALRLSAQGVSRPVPGGRTPRGFIFIVGLSPRISSVLLTILSTILMRIHDEIARALCSVPCGRAVRECRHHRDPAVQPDCYFKEALRPTRFRTVISVKPVV